MRTLATTSASVAAVAAGLFYVSPFARASSSRFPTSLPPQTVIVDPLQFAVLGQNATFRSNAFSDLFNPTNTSSPFFQVFDPAFLDILGPKPSIRAIASNPGFAFAHEAPIWVPRTNEVFFASNDGGDLGFSDIDHNNRVSKISLDEVASAIKNASDSTSALNVTVTPLDLPETVQMTNGGTGPFRGNLLLVNSGRGNLPPSITAVNPAAPHNVTVLLDNFIGRQFNSLNDIKIHPTSKKLFFTDLWMAEPLPTPPLMPSQVYRFDPDTGSVRVVADGFDRPNGVAFTKDGKTAYIADTGASGGFLGNNQTEPATIYGFDVDPRTQAFHNRRVFAYVDTGVADGVQLDSKGNVYVGTGDGVHVWNPEGTLLGKFFLGSTSANLIFANKGQLVILAETEIVLAQIAAEGFNLAF
ncbi:D-lactonohydrolase-like protein [Irpex lacteus]|nr:D-lactonohydrolase-like protein [Irpex lacteus]